jgi:hypothetical protein
MLQNKNGELLRPMVGGIANDFCDKNVYLIEQRLLNTSLPGSVTSVSIKRFSAAASRP